MTEPPRPTPLRDAAKITGGAVGGLGGVSIAVVSLTSALSSGLTALNITLTAVAALVTAVVGASAAYATAIRAEPHVTPLASPQNDAGQPLVPVVPRPSNSGELL